MNLIIPNVSRIFALNSLWRYIKRTPLAQYIAHASQVVPAAYLLKGDKTYAEHCARSLFAEPLRGAGSGWESKMALPMEPGATSPLVTTGANVINFQVPDWCQVMGIRFAWQVAGTVTALVMDFDKYPSPTGVGTVVDKLDGTNGVLTAPTVAGQAIGNVLYRDIADTLYITLDPGNSVQAIVTTTTTAGSGVPSVIVIPRAEVYANLSTMIESS